MKGKYRTICTRRKREVEKRLEGAARTGGADGAVIQASNIHYEISDKTSAMNRGGIGVIHQFVRRSGLISGIDEGLHLLKRHMPYHESDHVLTQAYNVLCGGRRLEDIELLRNNPCFLDALDAERIPDPTTAGDFLRRFDQEDIEALMEVHQRQSSTDLAEAWEESQKEPLSRGGLHRR